MQRNLKQLVKARWYVIPIVLDSCEVRQLGLGIVDVLRTFEAS